MLTSDLDKEQVTRIKEGFVYFDKNNQKKIQIDQIGSAMRYLGYNPSEEDIKNIIRDQQNSSSDKEKIDFSEFISVMKLQKMKPVTVEDAINAFECFIKDGDAVISFEDLTNIMTSTGEKFTKEEIELLKQDVQQCEILGSQNGQIDYRVYAKLLTSNESNLF